ncbi:MAG TPA: hypothetical protein VMV69_27530 [Pirellulales bacterium]|nr:hypothetical protein [Pirellulales bacterium]
MKNTEEPELLIMSESDIRGLVWQIASRCAANGPGWAQEGVVLREIGDQVASRLG